MEFSDAVLQGALAGLLVGAIAGLLPLLLGIFRKENKRAFVGFVGCVIAGVIGGLYASVAVMAIALIQILRPSNNGNSTETNQI